VAAWVEANDGCRREILELLRQEGPLTTTAFDDTCEVPWPSSGWNNHRNITMLLKNMVARGEVAAAGREGRQKLWDLAERIYPDDEVPDPDEAMRIREERRLRALGLVRPRTADEVGDPVFAGTAGETAVVEGVRGEGRVEPSLLDAPFTGRAALLSPLDRLVGKLDATAEPEEGVLRVDAVHEDVEWPAETREAVAAEIEALAGWLELEVMYVE
jgi:uncharacterized protein YcaQ